jgi:hypothetical protein
MHERLACFAESVANLLEGGTWPVDSPPRRSGRHSSERLQGRALPQAGEQCGGACKVRLHLGERFATQHGRFQCWFTRQQCLAEASYGRAFGASVRSASSSVSKRSPAASVGVDSVVGVSSSIRVLRFSSLSNLPERTS